MRVKHLLVNDQPDWRSLMRDRKLITFNTRSDGDSDDSLITICAYLYTRDGEDGYYLAYQTPEGVKSLHLSSDELSYRITTIMEIIE